MLLFGRDQRVHSPERGNAALNFVVGTFGLWLLLDVLGLLQRELATLGNGDLDGGLVAGLLVDILDLVDDVVALNDLAEDDVLAVQPGRDGRGNEELRGLSEDAEDSLGILYLRAIGIFTRVGHAQEALLGVLELEVLVLKFRTIDRFPTSACRNLV